MPDIHPRRVLVIGGGVAGLVTLRNLIKLGEQTGHFDRVELVERRDDVGGVWYLDPEPRSSASNLPPNDTANGITNGTSRTPRWPSPAYPGLVGNVLPEYLSFSDYPPFPTPAQPADPFPTLAETHEYLKGFAASLSPGRIRLNTEVVRVMENDALPSTNDRVEDKDVSSAGPGWTVVLRDWNNGGEEREEVWDAIVSAVGYYDNPVWPDVPGMNEVRAAGLAEHAQAYRGPQGLEGKRVLVIGNANSSNDIATHAAPIAQTPVFRSIRRPALFTFPSLPDSRIKDVAPVREYEVVEGEDGRKQVRATLTDGTVIDHIDAVRVGTGYRPSPNFIHVRSRAPGDARSGTLTPLMHPPPAPHRIPALHRHILYAPNPSLAFNGSAMSYTPFTIADVTSAWLALAWSGEVAYPEGVEERLESERERLRGIEEARAREAEEALRRAAQVGAAQREGGPNDAEAPSSDGAIETSDGEPLDTKDIAAKDANGTAAVAVTTAWTSGPSDFLSYNIFGPFEQGYAAGLRADIVRARPELDKVLPEWNAERTKKRETMYALKFRSLEWARNRREAARVQHNVKDEPTASTP
ncbi:hypothetical protein HDZ31DRAFT_81448 [Schizophyllum fasciatum]